MSIIARDSGLVDPVNFEEWTEQYFIKAQDRVYEYELCMHLVKQNMSITEACIATLQRIERDNFQEQRWTKKKSE